MTLIDRTNVTVLTVLSPEGGPHAGGACRVPPTAGAPQAPAERETPRG
jgi:hypothetical protein